MNRSGPTLYELLLTRLTAHPHACLLFALLVTVLAGTQIFKLKFDDDFRNLFKTSATAQNRSESKNDLTCLLMVYGPSVTNRAGLQTIHTLHDQLTAAPQVDRVNSMLDARRPRRVGKYFLPHFPAPDADEDRIQAAAASATAHPMLAGQFLTDDQQATLLFVRLDPSLKQGRAINDAVTRVREIANEALADTPFEYKLTGLPVVRLALADVFTLDQLKFNVGGALAAICVSMFVFRNALATFVVVLGPVIGVLWSMAAMATVGEPLNIVNGMVAPLTLAIGLTAAVHMMYHYRDGRRRGVAAPEAARSVWRVVVPACAWAAFTTLIGFLTLTLAQLETIRHFGLMCAMAVGCTFVAVVSTLPSLCVILGIQFDRRQRAQPDPAADNANRSLIYDNAILNVIVDHPGPVCIVAILSLVVSVSLAMQLQPTISISEALPASGDTLAALQHVEREFKGSLPITAVLEWSSETGSREVINALQAVDQALREHSEFTPPLSLATILQTLPGDSMSEKWAELRHLPPEIVNEFLDTKGRRSFLFFRCPDIGNHRLHPIFEDMYQQFDEIVAQHPTVQLRLTEVIAESVNVGNGMIRDLARSLVSAVPLIALVMIFVLRSWKLGLVSILPNVFPLAATAACIVLLGWHLRLFTVSLFAIFFGIAVDDTIHIMLRFQRERQRGALTRGAIFAALEQVGPAVITTTVVLSAGMSVLLLSEIFGIRRFGFLFCCGLFWALVGDLIFLPAVLSWCFGRDYRTGRSPTDKPEPVHSK